MWLEKQRCFDSIPYAANYGSVGVAHGLPRMNTTWGGDMSLGRRSHGGSAPWAEVSGVILKAYSFSNDLDILVRLARSFSFVKIHECVERLCMQVA